MTNNELIFNILNSTDSILSLNEIHYDEINLIMENIIEFLNITPILYDYYSITIYTNQKIKFQKILSNKNGMNLKIYTKFHSKKMLQDIITNIETQNYFKYKVTDLLSSNFILKNKQNQIRINIV